MKIEKLSEYIELQNNLDEGSEMFIDSDGIYIDKSEAIQIIDHLTKVFEIEKEQGK